MDEIGIAGSQPTLSAALAPGSLKAPTGTFRAGRLPADGFVKRLVTLADIRSWLVREAACRDFP
jgi:hypothetical protein